MNVLRGLALAFSCFSIVPMPQIEWKGSNMRTLMCFFPFVGIVIGLVLGAWCWLANAAGFGPALFGAGLALLPALVSGGIHFDGFCDVIDAQSSHATPARKREILKDPHIGAFAAIGVAIYLVAYTALGSELAPGWQLAVLLGGLHVASRCLSAIATLTFPTSASKGMLSLFHESGRGAAPLVAVTVELVACIAIMAIVHPVAGISIALAGVACLALLYPFATTQFGGMSGDIAGFFLQVTELCMLATLVVVSKVVGL